MKKWILLLVILASVGFAGRHRIIGLLRYYGITSSPLPPKAHYEEMVKMFDDMHEDSGGIVFLGDSITEFLNVDEFLPSYHIIKRGIAGDTTSGVLRRLGEVIALKPRKLFLLIGTNDIGIDLWTTSHQGNCLAHSGQVPRDEDLPGEPLSHEAHTLKAECVHSGTQPRDCGNR